jgi:uncharacterized protein (DUF983 family)
MLRGFRRRCPRCGEGALLAGYLKPVAACRHCGEAYAEMRADDFQPYLTILIVGHVIVPLVLFAHQQGMPPSTAIALWVPATIALTAMLLPRCKGAILGLMWSLGLSGNETQ